MDSQTHQPAAERHSTQMPLFPPRSAGAEVTAAPYDLAEELCHFTWDGRRTRRSHLTVNLPGGATRTVPTFTNQFWTEKQRRGCSLHEISYRACFKPQLPAFFIDRLTRPGDAVYDPFMGRGTTPLEAALRRRIPLGNDVNPLALILCRPRLEPPLLADVDQRLSAIPFHRRAECPDDLLVFYHPDTLREICALRAYLLDRQASGTMDAADRWIQMVAVSRLTGHSAGFFSVYTLPPNQAVSVDAQRKINRRLGQVPPRRIVPDLIRAKTASLLRRVNREARDNLAWAAERAALITNPADRTPEIPSASVRLVVTSPPFLDVVDYAADNWLRSWFCGIDIRRVPITALGDLDAWAAAMKQVFLELHRVLAPGGYLAFEVGEVRGGELRLEEVVAPCGAEAGLEPALVLINEQAFTKTANCWGVKNNVKGTNTNRVVLFRKPGRGPSTRR